MNSPGSSSPAAAPETWTRPARLTQDLLTSQGYTTQTQASDAAALLDGAGHTYARVRSGVVVRQGGQPVAVIDAKYKNYAGAGDDGQPVRLVGDDDLYQLFFYASRLGHAATDSTVPAFIVVPAPTDPAAWIADRYRTVRWQVGATHGSLRIILLPIADVLAELQGYDFEATRCQQAAIAFGDL